MNNIGTSYLLWLGYLFGLAGLQRFYNKKFATGFLWLFTFGVFGVGQFVDLFLIPGMVDEHNLKVRRKLGLSPVGVPGGYDPINPTLAAVFRPPTNSQMSLGDRQSLSPEKLMVELARVAYKRGGKLSVTQAVIDTGVGFEKVQATLNEMAAKGYVSVDNHPQTGVVTYDFVEL